MFQFVGHSTLLSHIMISVLCEYPPHCYQPLWGVSLLNGLQHSWDFRIDICSYSVVSRRAFRGSCGAGTTVRGSNIIQRNLVQNRCDPFTICREEMLCMDILPFHLSPVTASNNCSRCSVPNNRSADPPPPPTEYSLIGCRLWWHWKIT